MDPWWTRCPICNAETKPCVLPFWQRALRKLVQIEAPPLRDFFRVCPTHGRVKLYHLRHAAHECRECGYDLRGSSASQCPECGWQIPESFKRELPPI